MHVYAVLYPPEILTLWPLLNFQRSLETRQVSLERANTTHLWQQVSRFVPAPVGIALAIVRVDVHRESAKAVIESLINTLVVEGLAQLFSNDRAFLDPGVKEASDLVDT